MKDSVNMRTHGLNCMRTGEAKQLICNSFDETNIKAMARLNDWQSEKLASSFYQNIDSWQCSFQYLASICNRKHWSKLEGRISMKIQ